MRHALLLLAAVILLAQLPKSDAPILVKPDAHQTLVNPNCSHCKDEAKRRAGELRDGDRVLCWIRGYSDGGAIPYRFFLVPYRVISDTYGVFVYDHEAGFVRGFEPSLEFTFHGWRKGVMVIKHKDGTLFSALTGEAFDGPRTGQRLKLVPTLESDWGYWLKEYPNAVAYHMFDKYKAVEMPIAGTADSVRTRPAADRRLGVEVPVFGVRVGNQTRAYPISLLEKSGGILTDSVGDTPVVILWYGPTRTAAAYKAQLPVAKPGEAVSFAMDQKTPLAPFTDSRTQSHWDIAGRAMEGPLKGKTLEWLDGVQVKWFAWAAEYPETSLYAAR